MKKFFTFALTGMLLISCDLLLGKTEHTIYSDILEFSSIKKLGNSTYSQINAKDITSQPNAVTLPNTLYIGVKIDKEKAIIQEKRSSEGVEHKPCVFDDSSIAPSSYPEALIIDTEEYLLFSTTHDFKLYKKINEAEDRIVFKKSTLWDFSAISNYVSSILYKGENQAWIFSPCWSEARQTLYFTLAKWEENVIKGDFIRIRVYQSKLIGASFQTPTETTGVIDPYDPSHYTDGFRHTESDFPGRMGIGWIGRLYITADGNHAYFNALNVSFGDTYGILKPDSPWIFPEPNCQNFGSSGVTNLNDARVIQTAVYQADIDTAGNFVNLSVLPPIVNQGGVNFVSDISNDGTTLMVSHMDIDDTFRASGWGADGLALQVCMSGAEDVELWNGYLIEYQGAGENWVVVNEIGKEITTSSVINSIPDSIPIPISEFDETAFRSSRPWIPNSSTITPMIFNGQSIKLIIDHESSEFIDDTKVRGTWLSVSFVKTIDEFDASISRDSKLFWRAVSFQSSGKILIALDNDTLMDYKHLWKKGYVIFYPNQMNPMCSQTDSKYVIKTINGVDYLFIQWKSGDYTWRGDQPYYYVFMRS